MKTLTKEIDYFDLDRHFTAPKVISPFYGEIKRLSRKEKKELKKFDVYNHNFLTLGQKLWNKLTVENPNYVRFLIKMICENEQRQKTRTLHG
jgi:hypothetical protein